MDKIFQIVRIKYKLLSPFQIIRHLSFSRYISFTMYLDIVYIWKSQNILQFGMDGVIQFHKNKRTKQSTISV